jgi:hypothetical protein
MVRCCPMLLFSTFMAKKVYKSFKAFAQAIRDQKLAQDLIDDTEESQFPMPRSLEDQSMGVQPPTEQSSLDNQ